MPPRGELDRREEDCRGAGQEEDRPQLVEEKRERERQQARAGVEQLAERFRVRLRESCVQLEAGEEPEEGGHRQGDRDPGTSITAFPGSPEGLRYNVVGLRYDFFMRNAL